MLAWRHAVVATFLVVGCGDAFTSADGAATSAAGGGTTTATGGNGGSPTMAATTSGMGGGPSCIELPAVPNGWTPTLLGLGHDLACDGGGDERQTNLRNVQPYTCGCACASECAVNVDFDPTPGCGTPGRPTALADGACVATSAYAVSQAVTGLPCVPETTAVEPPAEPYETDPITLCDLAPEASGCVPIDAGYLATLCVRAPGNDACPEGFQAWEGETFESVDDGRGCAQCGCDSDTGNSCPLTKITVHTNDSCNPNEEVGQITQLCDAVSGSHATAAFNTSCTPTGGPTGEVSPVNEERLCCTHPPPPGTLGD